jgi:hypothetical protein
MIKWALAALVLLLSTQTLAQLGTVGPPNAVLCNRTFTVSAGATTLTQAVAAVGPAFTSAAMSLTPGQQQAPSA